MPERQGRHALIPPEMLEEKGLTIEEIPPGQNPWGDPRYVTQIESKDTVTGQVYYFKFERVHAPNYRHADIYISGLLEGLAGRPLMTAWTLWEKLLERAMFIEREDEHQRRLMADHSHVQAQVRELATAMRSRLEVAKAEFTGFRELLLARGLGKAFDNAVKALCELHHAADRVLTLGQFESSKRRLLDAGWMVDRPAIAFAIHALFSGNATRYFTCREIHCRIARFEITFLKNSIDESGTSVAREISRFKRNHNRVQTMEKVLGELLAGEWFVWPLGAEGMHGLRGPLS